MARKAAKTKKKRGSLSWRQRQWRKLRFWLMRGTLWAASVFIFLILIPIVINPPMTLTMYAEKLRLGEIDKQWVAIEEVHPAMARSVVAAEDANFCLHWGFDIEAIRDALEDGAARGASTITQQTVKNVYLWQGRSWFRKALEALITPFVELAWSKQRILEVYLNVAEFDEGVFGIEAASRHYFGVGPESLTPRQASRLAAVLPAPKTRSASRPNEFLRRRSAQIMDGAATIDNDGRAACFQ